jgi:alpha-tubulin suppressor-like RCC1 family protein
MSTSRREVLVGGLAAWLSAASSAGAATIVTRGTLSAESFGFGAAGAAAPPGKLFAWGINSVGQLGLNNRTSYNSPIQVGALTTWNAIVSGQVKQTLAINNGKLYAWGANTDGALGLGVATTVSYSSPKQVGALTTWTVVSTGAGHSAGITSGKLYTWGLNNFGQLGLNNTTNYSSPKQVGAGTNWASVLCSMTFTMAITTTGKLYAWGRSQFGQLGLGVIVSYSSPKQVGALTTWASVAALRYGVLGLTTTGKLYAWGQNNFGQLGFGNISNYSSPKQVGAGTNWSSVAIADHALAVTTSGKLYAWGYNYSGALGLNNTTNYSSPKQVGALTTWKSVSVSWGSSLDASAALTTGGALFTWGANISGQLGLNNTTNYSSPKQVGALTTWKSLFLGGYENMFGIHS